MTNYSKQNHNSEAISFWPKFQSNVYNNVALKVKKLNKNKKSVKIM